MKEKNYVMVTATGYFPNVGGVENSLYYLSRSFHEKGYSVDLVASNSTSDWNNSIPKLKKENGFKVFRYNYYFFRRKNPLVGYFNAIILYRRLRKRNNYRLVVCRDHVTVLLCWLSGLKNTCYVLPSVMKYQVNINKNSGGKLKRFNKYLAYFYHHLVQKLAVRVSRHNCVFSDAMENQLVHGLGCFEKPIRTVPGVDILKFSLPNKLSKIMNRAALCLDDKDFVLLGLGRFVDVKGFDFAIRSMSFLPNNFKLLLVGSGPKQENYQKLIEDLALGERVKILPQTFYPESFYKIADAFVLPSVYEPFGQTLIEAQATGLPVVAFSNSLAGINTATESIVNNFTSIMAMEVSDESFANAIQNVYELISDGTFRSESIAEYVKIRFSWDRTCNDLLERC